MPRRLRHLLPSALLAFLLVLGSCSGSDPAGPMPDPEPEPLPGPDAVADLAVADAAETAVVLTWTAPADHAGEAVAAYEIRHGEPGLGDWADWTVVAEPPVPAAPGERQQCTVPLPAGTGDRLFRLLSRDAEGRASLPSNAVTGTPRPPHDHVLRVAVDGSGDHPTIQAAIEAAGPGDLILVGPGRYTWTEQGTGDVHGLIRFDREVQDITLRSELGAAATVLDAERLGRVVFIQGYNDGVVIDGFTVTGGLAPADGYYCGGGIIAHLTSPTIRNCVVTGNEARWVDGDWGGQGGGIWWGGVSACRIESCVVTGNQADYGGGLFFVNSSEVCVVTGCVISYNQAEYVAGGIGGGNHCLRLEDSLLIQNVAQLAGGGWWGQDMRSSSIEGCTFARDISQAGSGVFVRGTGGVTVRRSVFADAIIGAVFATADGAALEAGCCVFHGNADGSGLDAVAVDLGGLLEADPLFCDPEADDFGLLPGSPCADDGGACGVIGAVPPGCGGW